MKSSSIPESLRSGRGLRWVALVIALVSLTLFAALASEMLEAETEGLDFWALHAAQQWRASHGAIESTVRDLTGLGSTVVLTLLTLLTAGYLWLDGHRDRAVVISVAMASGSLAVTALKNSFGRARPDPALAAFAQDGLSFPSGHASMSAVFFLTLGVLLAQTHDRLSVRIYLICASALITACIGISRVLLGVHWASDVLGGWAFGAGWAALWFCAALQLRDTALGSGARR